MFNSAALFAGTLLRLLALSSAACPPLPTGSSQAAAAKKLVTCVGLSDIKAVPKSVGNVFISKLSAIRQNQTTCDKKGTEELTMQLKAGAGIIELGETTCTLEAAVLHKSSSKADAKVGLRLDFNNCSKGAKKATVALDVVSDSTAEDTVVPFLRGTCGVATTTPALSQEKTVLKFSQVQVGASACKATSLEDKTAVGVEQCRDLCVNRVPQAVEGVSFVESPDACKGYAYKAGDKSCRLYKGPVTNITTDSKDKDFLCFNLTATATTVAVSTAAPPSAKELAEAEEKKPKMEISITASTASVKTYGSTEAVPCFESFHWITLKDAMDMPVKVRVKQSDWTEMLDMIPFAVGESEAVTSRRLAASPAVSMTIDHAVYADEVVQTLHTTPVPDEFTSTPEAVVEVKTVGTYEDCVAGEVGNAIVSAVFVPLATWGAVYFAFGQLGAKQGYKQVDSAEGEGSGCTTKTSLTLIACAAVVAIIAAIVFVLIMGFIFNGICVASSFDLTLIRVSSALTTICTVGMGLFYLSTKHHATHVAANVTGDAGDKFMIVKVQGNKHVPVAHNDMVDPHASGKAGSSIYMTQN